MIALCLLAQAMQLFIAKKLLVAWAHPVVLLSLCWTVILFLTAGLAGEYYFSPSAALSICGLQLVSLCGGGAGLLVRKRQSSANAAGELRHVRPLLWASLIVGLVSIAQIAGSRGFSPSQLLNFDVLFDASREFSAARYQDEYRMPLVSRLAQMFVMFGVLVSGFAFASPGQRIKPFEYFLPFLPLLMTAVLLTTRATVVFGVLLWVAAYFASSFRVAARINWSPMTLKRTVAGVAVCGTFAFIFVALQFMRGGITDLGRLPEILAHLKKWPLGGFAGFSAWFDSYATAPSEPALGYYTFTGIFDLLGIRDRQTGIYLDYVDLGDGSFGNVYTAFRGALEDFGVFGAIGVFFALGAISSVALKSARHGSFAGAAVLTALYPAVFFSHVVSFYSYFGHVAAVASFAVYLRVCSTRRRSAS